ncbi:RpsA1 [Desulfamplus magnetovallimortis]|uniref:RpsA1 n=1 Tax=Desulfamplus magnetovallimortis TaxID=1246637 RepID=A0A1W1HL46_9BACT|nr:30S ribosomal protein S1 [Desulfamplus magnetovallimortis]SLM33211.1 RpsA1 [Desulfamplus magnetovallimortis]
MSQKFEVNGSGEILSDQEKQDRGVSGADMNGISCSDKDKISDSDMEYGSSDISQDVAPGEGEKDFESGTEEKFSQESEDDHLPDNMEQEESFEALLNSYDAEISHDIRQGDKIDGTIISIGKNSVYVSTGTKSDGVVDKAELLDENGEFPYNEGDTLSLYVVSSNESEVILSRALSGAGSVAMLEEASMNKTPVEGKVAGIVKGGFSVAVMGKRAFCPVSQIDTRYVEENEQESYIGKTFSFLVTRYSEGGKNIVLSRRSLLQREIKESRETYLKTISEGDIVQGKVVKLMPYGAFVELAPGVEGMIHISELSWARVDKSSDAVAEDQSMMVKILKIETKKGADTPKISLSLKQTSMNPWETVEKTFSVGEQITGKVVRLAPFGAFVEIAPGVDGLVHLSEMSHTKRVLKAEDVVEQGETIQVAIKEIDMEHRRISLSMKDTHGDPWDGAASRYPKGTVVEGKTEKREKFGIFINLEPGVTGLLPGSAMAKAADASLYDRLKPGDSVTVMVEDISEDTRRISLAPPDMKEGDDWKAFAKVAEKPKESVSTSGMGTMGDLLLEAMKKK